MANEDSKPLTEEERARGKITQEERRELGAKKLLWGIEIICRLGVETKRHHLANQTDREVFDFRKNIFVAGIMIPHEPGVWVVVPPWEITMIFITRQSKFFEP